MESIAIEVDNITKIFRLNKPEGLIQALKNLGTKPDTFAALDNISFTVSKGEVLGIIGKNGSGKTTLLRTIAGIYRPNSGHVHNHGSMAPLLQIGTGFQEELNAIENIVISGMFFGIPKSRIKEKVENIIEYAELERFSNTKLKHFSTGMRARLAFSTAIQMDPDILLVDEILAVGDMSFRKKSFEKFLSFKEKGKTILFTTHNLDAIEQISNRVLLLDMGKVISLDTPEKSIKKYHEILNLPQKES